MVLAMLRFFVGASMEGPSAKTAAGRTMQEPGQHPNLLVSLSDAELKKTPPPTNEAIRKALAEGNEERRAAESAPRPLPTTSRVLFR